MRCEHDMKATEVQNCSAVANVLVALHVAAWAHVSDDGEAAPSLRLCGVQFAAPNAIKSTIVSLMHISPPIRCLVVSRSVVLC